jgi:hypothetical protein
MEDGSSLVLAQVLDPHPSSSLRHRFVVAWLLLLHSVTLVPAASLYLILQGFDFVCHCPPAFGLGSFNTRLALSSSCIFAAKVLVLFVQIKDYARVAASQAV